MSTEPTPFTDDEIAEFRRGAKYNPALERLAATIDSLRERVGAAEAEVSRWRTSFGHREPEEAAHKMDGIIREHGLLTRENRKVHARAEAAERSEAEVGAQNDRILAMHTCGCEVDFPGDYCMVHAPRIQTAEAARDAALALLREIAGHLCDCGTECYSGPERQSRIDAFLASQPQQETP